MAKGVQIDLIVDPKGAIEGIGKASDSASSATSVFSSLGKIGATAVAALGTAAVAAAGSLALATRSASKYADDILTVATNTGLSTDELQAYKYAAELTDVSFDTFVKSQGKFTKSMQDSTRSATSPAAEAFAALGLSVTNSDGSLKDSTKLYWESIDALKGVSNETERTALAQDIFGKSGADMNSLIAQGSAGFKELTEQARANGAVMSGEQLNALGAFDDKMQSLTATVGAAKNALGLTLLPILDDLAGDGGNALGQFTSALLDANGDLTKAGPAFETLGTNIGAALTTAIPKILQVATSLVSGLVDGIVKQAPQLIQTAIPLIVNFTTGILKMLPAILNAGIKVLVALVQGIAAALPTLIPAAVDAVVGLVKALVDNAPLVLQAGLELILGLAKGIIDSIPALIAALPAIIIGIIDYVIGAIPMVIDAGIQLLLALVGALPDIIVGIVDAIPKIISGIITAVIGAIPKLIDAGVKLLIALVENTPTIIVEIIKAIPEIIKGIVGAFTDPAMLGQIAKAGSQLIMGLWNGIKDMGAWLWKQISGFFNGVISNIKNLFGIHSPSTVFAGFGDNMIAGLVGGIKGGYGLVTNTMGDLSEKVSDGFQSSLAVDAKTTVAASGGVGLSGGGGDVHLHLHGFVGGEDTGRAAVQALQEYVRGGGRGLGVLLGR